MKKLILAAVCGLMLQVTLRADPADDPDALPAAPGAAKSVDYDQAIANDTQVIQNNPHDAQAYFKRAFVYMQTGDDDKAIADLTQAIQINPKYAQAYFRRAFVYMMKGNYDQATADLTQAIEINPQFKMAYYRRACVTMMNGNCDQAISDLNKAIEIDPKFLQAYLRRSYAYMVKGDYAQAITALEQFIQDHPNGSFAYNRLAWLLATCPQGNIRNGRKAVEDATKACELGGWKASMNLDTLAAAYAETGDFLDAVKWENEAIANQGDKALVEAQKSRRALYEDYKSYHVEKYDAKFQAIVN